MSVESVPAGYTSLTPVLCVGNGANAIDFYVTAFGGRLVERMDTRSGAVAHAELDFGHGRLQLCDALPDHGLTPPEGDGPVAHSTVLYCDDIDGVVARAVALGATIREPVSDFVTGDRYASIIDPFGHRWAVLTRVEDVSPSEADRRLAEWSAAEFD